MKCVVFTRPDGNISIVHPVQGFLRELQNGFIDSERVNNLCSWMNRPDQTVTEKYKRDMKFKLSTTGLTEDEALDFIRRRDVPVDATAVQIVDKESLPKDRYFRNTWRQAAGKVFVDMNLAKEQRMKEIRTERDKRLKDSDGPFMRAMEREEGANDLKAMRQALRDIPQNTDLSAINTPDELKAFKPEWPN